MKNQVAFNPISIADLDKHIKDVESPKKFEGRHFRTEAKIGRQLHKRFRELIQSPEYDNKWHPQRIEFIRFVDYRNVTLYIVPVEDDFPHDICDRNSLPELGQESGYWLTIFETFSPNKTMPNLEKLDEIKVENFFTLEMPFGDELFYEDAKQAFCIDVRGICGCQGITTIQVLTAEKKIQASLSYEKPTGPDRYKDVTWTFVVDLFTLKLLSKDIH